MREMLSILLLLGLLSSAQARLDETRGETTARFGQPCGQSNSAPKDWMYKKGGFFIIVEFLKDRVGKETYSRQGLNDSLSPEDEQTFLKANAAGQQWVKDPQTPGRWTRTDGATAQELIVSDKLSDITFTSKGFLDAQAEAKAELEREEHPPIDRSGF